MTITVGFKMFVGKEYNHEKCSFVMPDTTQQEQRVIDSAALFSMNFNVRKSSRVGAKGERAKLTLGPYGGHGKDLLFMRDSFIMAPDKYLLDRGFERVVRASSGHSYRSFDCEDIHLTVCNDRISPSAFPLKASDFMPILNGYHPRGPGVMTLSTKYDTTHQLNALFLFPLSFEDSVELSRGDNFYGIITPTLDTPF